MAVKDIRSNIEHVLMFTGNITTDTTTIGAILDTANFELGLMFSLTAIAYVDGTYTLELLESDDPGMAGAVPIAGDKLIGPLPVLSGVSIIGDRIQTVGIISNLRFVQGNIVSTGVSSGSNINIDALQKGESVPLT